ncbi:MAG: ribonuclease G [Chlamydiae bacterium SM23_39]|nr:MAG: ribonuclease G [Chlamydiae bacterium SM23_39]
MKEIILNIENKERRYALLKFGKLEELIIERKNSRQITGNIYRGKVINILHNIQSAFIDINEGENGFIHISDILENTKKFEEMFDMDFDIQYDSSSYKNKKMDKDINQLLKKDQPVLVQVVKEPIGTKGARLTSNISIPGRYLVLLPNMPHKGVSRKIEDKELRDKLKKIINSFKIPKKMGFICRTASANTTEKMLKTEAHDLLKKWNDIVKKFEKSKSPTCLFEESDLIKRSVLTAIDKKLDRILIDNYQTYKYAKKIYSSYSNEHPLKIEFYKYPIPIFEKYKIEEEIEKALHRKIWLKCGGYLFFDQTEAMHTVDVNSGKSLQNETPSNLEEALVRINLEAAEEIARQFRIRNIGGLIICDFIDMRYKKNQRRILEKLKECTKEDSAKCTILRMSELGLVEMTRQRKRESILQIIFTNCPYCMGTGMIKSKESLVIEIERILKKILLFHKQRDIQLFLHPEMLNYLNQKYFIKTAKKYHGKIEFQGNDNLHLNKYIFISKKTNNPIEI